MRILLKALFPVREAQSDTSSRLHIAVEAGEGSVRSGLNHLQKGYYVIYVLWCEWWHIVISPLVICSFYTWFLSAPTFCNLPQRVAFQTLRRFHR